MARWRRARRRRVCHAAPPLQSHSSLSPPLLAAAAQGGAQGVTKRVLRAAIIVPARLPQAGVVPVLGSGRPVWQKRHGADMGSGRAGGDDDWSRHSGVP